MNQHQTNQPSAGGIATTGGCVRLLGCLAVATFWSSIAIAQPLTEPKTAETIGTSGNIATSVFTTPDTESTVQISDRVSLSFLLETDQAGMAESVNQTSGQWQVVDSVELRAGVGFAPQTAAELRPDCQSVYHIDCASGQTASINTDRQVQSYSVGANWQASDRIALDLNLYSQPMHSALGGNQFWRGEFVELDLSQTEGIDLGLSCGFKAGRLGEIELGLQVSHIDEQNALLEQDPLAAASLGLGWRKGALSGDLTSRFLGSINDDHDVQDGWTTFDISFGWRTPWNGSLSVGARNVLDTPAPDSHLLNNNSNIDDVFGRVPYVRYQQDL